MKRAAPTVGGLYLAASIILLAAALPPQLALDWFAIVLAVVAAIRLGFAFVDGRKRGLTVEVAFAGLALAELWFTPLLLTVGYVL